MIWLLLPLALAAIGWMVWKGTRDKHPAQRVGWLETGPAPEGSAAFLERLGLKVGLLGGEVRWSSERVPSGYAGGTAAENVVDPWTPKFDVQAAPDWKALLVHAAGHVPLMRRGDDSEPDPGWCARVVAELG